MQTTTFKYPSPVGNLVLLAERGCLAGLWFEGFPVPKLSANADVEDMVIEDDGQRRDAPSNGLSDAEAIMGTVNWLNLFFLGISPDSLPPLLLRGTAFQVRVWRELLKINFGTTITYGALARRLSSGDAHPTSPRAVGGAVGRNPIAIIVPCHRVVGANNRIGGYAYGTNIKRQLIKTEGLRGPLL